LTSPKKYSRANEKKQSKNKHKHKRKLNKKKRKHNLWTKANEKDQSSMILSYEKKEKTKIINNSNKKMIFSI